MITNAHVIAEDSSTNARLQNGRTFEAELVNLGPGFDLACCVSNASNLPVAG